MINTGQDIFNFLSNYGYWIMVPLMIIEGPIATIIAAMLASFGVFNWLAVLTFSILGDVAGDVIWYGLGYRYGIKFVNSFGKYAGITEKLVVGMKEYFVKHGGKTIFAVKSTTGLCWVTFVAAGIIKMNFKKFIIYSILGGIVWSGFLVAMGYFYGYLWREIGNYIQWIGWLVAGVAIVSYMLITLYKKNQSKRIIK
jgi:membrane protein DedA with SNARE-associated domain